MGQVNYALVMRTLLFYLCFLVFVPLHGFADSVWSIEIGTGSAHSFSTTLQIQQTNEPEIRIGADYATRPWEDAPYYDWRVSYRKKETAWELEFLHHKLYLENDSPEIQHFEVSHGYNMLFVNHLWKLRYFDFRAGAGPVISHTESVIRDLALDTGYDLSGVAGQVGVGKRLYLSQRFFLNLETKLTFSNANVSVAEGEASVPNFAIHGLIGIGYDFPL
jgi:hypothetical protein